MRWDAYNGGFDSYPWGSLSTGASAQQQIVAELDATHEGILTAEAIGLNLVTELSGTKEWLRQAFERLIGKCQTPYGFYVNSPNLNRYPRSKPWESEVKHNFYAVSILNLSDNTQILGKGSFRWPPDVETFVESLNKSGGFIPFVVIVVVLPYIIAILWTRTREKVQTNMHNVTLKRICCLQ